MAEEGIFTLKEKVCLESGVINTIVAMYQVALSKVLGSGSKALTQLILREATEIADKMFEEINLDISKIGDPEKTIPEILRMFEIAEKVTVEKSPTSDMYVVKIYDSVFKPVAMLLSKKNIEFTLSPEAFIVAYILSKALKEKNPKAKITFKAEQMKSPENPLILKIFIRH